MDCFWGTLGLGGCVLSVGFRFVLGFACLCFSLVAFFGCCWAVALGGFGLLVVNYVFGYDSCLCFVVGVGVFLVLGLEVCFIRFVGCELLALCRWVLFSFGCFVLFTLVYCLMFTFSIIFRYDYYFVIMVA